MSKATPGRAPSAAPYQRQASRVRPYVLAMITVTAVAW